MTEHQVEAPLEASDAAARADARAAQAQGRVVGAAGTGATDAPPPVARASMPIGSRVGMNNEVREGDVDLNTALRRMLQMGGRTRKLAASLGSTGVRQRRE